MNVLYLLETLKTKKLSELVENMDAPLLDINVALWDAEKAGEVEIDREKDKIVALKEATPSQNEHLGDMIMRAIKHYSANEVNMTVGKLVSWVKNPAMQYNYLYHDYICSLQYLIDTGAIEELIVTVPEVKKKRPFHRFVFLCLPGNPNEEWNAKSINKWIENIEKTK